MTTITPAIYRTAADALRRDGWTQRYLHKDGMHCTLGALEVATGALALDKSSPVVRFLAAMLGDAGHIAPRATITSWNDAPQRTEDDAITLLEQAAEKLEAEQQGENR